MTCYYKDLSPLPEDVVWDLGGTQTAAYCQQAGRKVQKLKSFLAEIGGALDASFEEEKRVSISQKTILMTLYLSFFKIL